MTEELIKEALELVLDTTYHPVMVMCAYVEREKRAERGERRG